MLRVNKQIGQETALQEQQKVCEVMDIGERKAGWKKPCAEKQ